MQTLRRPEPVQAQTSLARFKGTGLACAFADLEGADFRSRTWKTTFNISRRKPAAAALETTAPQDAAKSSSAHLRSLVQLGCFQAQGFLLSPPVDAAAMEKILAAGTIDWRRG